MAEPEARTFRPDHAEAAFAFLADRGFTLRERRVTGGGNLHDGWRLTYERPDLVVTVQYFDAQFEVHFQRGDARAEYLFLDRELFERRSGLGGNMFSPPTLDPAIDRIAADIRDNYAAVLAGDDELWHGIERLLQAPRPRKRRLP